MAAEQVTEQVAEHIEEVAEVTRKIDTRVVGFFLGGVGVGAVIGFFYGYRFNQEKIKAELFKESEEEIARIREDYRQKILAAKPKPPVEQVLEERGYKAKTEPEPERPLPPPVPISYPQITHRTTLTEKDKMDGWSFPREMASRRSDQPFIIHQDEFAQNDSEYPQATYIYYVEDDVLADEDNTVITKRDELIGPNVLNRFGHGTDDYNILYVRNPVLELDIELCRNAASYEEEVLGLTNESGEDT